MCEILLSLQVFPGNLLEPTYTEPECKGILKARSEVERRIQYIQQLSYQLPRSQHGGEHQLIQLITSCLQNDPSDRPTSEDLLASLEEMKDGTEGPYGDIIRLDAVRQVTMMRAMRERDRNIRENMAESAEKDAHIHHLQQQLEHEQVF